MYFRTIRLIASSRWLSLVLLTRGRRSDFELATPGPLLRHPAPSPEGGGNGGQPLLDPDGRTVVNGAPFRQLRDNPVAAALTQRRKTGCPEKDF